MQEPSKKENIFVMPSHSQNPLGPPDSARNPADPLDPVGSPVDCQSSIAISLTIPVKSRRDEIVIEKQ